MGAPLISSPDTDVIMQETKQARRTCCAVNEHVRQAIEVSLRPFVFLGAEIIWLSDRGGLDQPSACIQPYIRCQRAAKPSAPSQATVFTMVNGGPTR